MVQVEVAVYKLFLLITISFLGMLLSITDYDRLLLKKLFSISTDYSSFTKNLVEMINDRKSKSIFELVSSCNSDKDLNCPVDCFDSKKNLNLKIFKFRKVFSGRNAYDLYVYGIFPESNRDTSEDFVPAIALFHGGGLDGGRAIEYLPIGSFLASKGIATFSFQYRVSSIHESKPLRAVEDTRNAIRWLIENWEVLRIRKGKVGVVGDSAGGLLSLTTGIEIPTNDADLGIYSPNLIIAAYPVVDAVRSGWIEAISPIHLVGQHKKVPIYILLPEEDKNPWTPPDLSRKYCSQLKNCTILPFLGSDHGFLTNFDSSKKQIYFAALHTLEKIFKKHNFIDSKGSWDDFGYHQFDSISPSCLTSLNNRDFWARQVDRIVKYPYGI